MCQWKKRRIRSFLLQFWIKIMETVQNEVICNIFSRSNFYCKHNFYSQYRETFRLRIKIKYIYKGFIIFEILTMFFNWSIPEYILITNFKNLNIISTWKHIFSLNMRMNRFGLQYIDNFQYNICYARYIEFIFI